VQSVSYLKAKTEYDYHSSKPYLLISQRNYVEGKLVKTRTIDWDDIRELPTKIKVLGVNNEVLEENDLTWQSNWPYLLKESVDQRYGRKNVYSYAGLRTVQQTLTRSVHPTSGAVNWTLLSTKELTKRDVTKIIDALTTQDQRETNLGYDSEGQVTSVAQGVNAASMEYDNDGRVILVHSTETLLENSYDASGFLVLEKTTFLKTGKQRMIQYTRTIDSEGVLQSATTLTTHPSGEVDTMQYSFKDGEIELATLNGVKVDF
jgi:YD repeat-containing protein